MSTKPQKPRQRKGTPLALLLAERCDQGLLREALEKAIKQGPESDSTARSLEKPFVPHEYPAYPAYMNDIYSYIEPKVGISFTFDFHDYTLTATANIKGYGLGDRVITIPGTLPAIVATQLQNGEIALREVIEFPVMKGQKILQIAEKDGETTILLTVPPSHPLPEWLQP